jgi:MFS family permease
MRRGLFLVSLPIFFITFSVPVQAKSLNASAFEIGLLFSIFTLALLVLRPLVGYGLDRFGRKPFMASALIFYAVAHVSFAMADSLAWMYVARLTQGVGAALLLITVDTITTDLTSDAERPRHLGRNIEIQTRSSIVGAMIGFSLVGAMGALAWQYSFGFYAVLALAGGIYLVANLRESRVHEVEHRPFVMTDGLRRLLSIVFIAGFTSALIQPIYLIYLQDSYDLAVRYLSWAFLPAALVFAFLPSRAGRLAQRFGSLNLLLAGFLLSGVVYLVLPFLGSLLAFVMLYTTASVGWALSEPARKALTASLGDGDSTGRNFGVTELYAGIGATIGPPVGGIIYDHFGAAPTFAMTGLLLIVSAMLAWILLNRIT